MIQRFALLLALVILFTSNIAQAQSFTTQCVLKQGSSTGKTFTELGENEAADAQRACRVVEQVGNFALVGDVKTMSSRKNHDPKAEAECAQFGRYCSRANYSQWSANCCALSIGGK